MKIVKSYFGFSCIQNMANFEAFRWNFSLSTNSEIGRCVLYDIPDLQSPLPSFSKGFIALGSKQRRPELYSIYLFVWIQQSADFDLKNDFSCPSLYRVALCVIFTILVSFSQNNVLFASKTKINIFWKKFERIGPEGASGVRIFFKKHWFQSLR